MKKIERNFLVVKANEFIQKTRFNLSLAEQKTLAYVCSMINSIEENNFQLEYDFSILQYCKCCGFDYNSGQNYQEIKATLKKLSDRSIWLDLGDSEVLVRFLAKVRTNKRSGQVHIKLDEDLVPYLFDLKKKFTKYQLYNILAMKSAFSIRLYEILKSYCFHGAGAFHKSFLLDDLKKMLMVHEVKSYGDFSLFRARVLEIALKEINNLTDITVTYGVIKESKKVVEIEFLIQYKAGREILSQALKVDSYLDDLKPIENQVELSI